MESDKAGGPNAFNVNITWGPQTGGLLALLVSQPQPCLSEKGNKKDSRRGGMRRGGRRFVSDQSRGRG